MREQRVIPNPSSGLLRNMRVTAGTLGGLIQTAVGSGLGEGCPFGNRSGCRANATASTRACCSRFATASPWWTSCGVNSPSSTW